MIQERDVHRPVIVFSRLGAERFEGSVVNGDGRARSWSYQSPMLRATAPAPELPRLMQRSCRTCRGARTTTSAETLDHCLSTRAVANLGLVQTVLIDGYASDLTDDELEQIGRDPFLIAYALADHGMRCVVTVESSEPKKQR